MWIMVIMGMLQPDQNDLIDMTGVNALKALVKNVHIIQPLKSVLKHVVVRSVVQNMALGEEKILVVHQTGDGYTIKKRKYFIYFLLFVENIFLFDIIRLTRRKYE